MDEEFGDFSTMATVGRGGEVELDSADGFAVEARDEDFDFVGGEGRAEFLPVGEGGFEGEREEEADTGAVGNAGLEDGGEGWEGLRELRGREEFDFYGIRILVAHQGSEDVAVAEEVSLCEGGINGVDALCPENG